MMNTTDDVTALLEAFQQALHAEDASWHTTSAYRADLQHFLTRLSQTTDACRLEEMQTQRYSRHVKAMA